MEKGTIDRLTGSIEILGPSKQPELEPIPNRGYMLSLTFDNMTPEHIKIIDDTFNLAKIVFPEYEHYLEAMRKLHESDNDPIVRILIPGEPPVGSQGHLLVRVCWSFFATILSTTLKKKNLKGPISWTAHSCSLDGTDHIPLKLDHPFLSTTLTYWVFNRKINEATVRTLLGDDVEKIDEHAISVSFCCRQDTDASIDFNLLYAFSGVIDNEMEVALNKLSGRDKDKRPIKVTTINGI